MATISSTGTWTAITALDTTDAAPTNDNVPRISKLNLESLKQTNGRNGVILPEIEQFIQLMAAGYNIGYWHAAQLLSVLLRAEMQTDVPETRIVYPGT